MHIFDNLNFIWHNFNYLASYFCIFFVVPGPAVTADPPVGLGGVGMDRGRRPGRCTPYRRGEAPVSTARHDEWQLPLRTGRLGDTETRQVPARLRYHGITTVQHAPGPGTVSRPLRRVLRLKARERNGWFRPAPAVRVIFQ